VSGISFFITLRQSKPVQPLKYLKPGLQELPPAKRTLLTISNRLAESISVRLMEPRGIEPLCCSHFNPISTIPKII